MPEQRCGSVVVVTEKPSGFLYLTVTHEQPGDGVHLDIEQAIKLRDSLNELPLEEARENLRNGPPPEMKLPDGLLSEPKPSA